MSFKQVIVGRIDTLTYFDTFNFFSDGNRSFIPRARLTVIERAAERIAGPIDKMLRRWVDAAKKSVREMQTYLYMADYNYRPGGPRYFGVRRDFMVRSGQSMATRGYQPTQVWW